MDRLLRFSVTCQTTRESPSSPFSFLLILRRFRGFLQRYGLVRSPYAPLRKPRGGAVFRAIWSRVTSVTSGFRSKRQEIRQGNGKFPAVFIFGLIVEVVTVLGGGSAGVSNLALDERHRQMVIHQFRHDRLPDLVQTLEFHSCPAADPPQP